MKIYGQVDTYSRTLSLSLSKEDIQTRSHTHIGIHTNKHTVKHKQTHQVTMEKNTCSLLHRENGRCHSINITPVVNWFQWLPIQTQPVNQSQFSFNSVNPMSTVNSVSNVDPMVTQFQLCQPSINCQPTVNSVSIQCRPIVNSVSTQCQFSINSVNCVNSLSTPQPRAWTFFVKWYTIPHKKSIREPSLIDRIITPQTIDECLPLTQAIGHKRCVFTQLE